MKINNMKLNNFQNVKKLNINFDSKDTKICGRNETGKTTVANAYSWLLTGKPYTGESNYSPQTIKDDELVHHLTHSVEAEFEKPDGSSMTLYRAYKEIWQTRRGSNEAELKGGTNEFKIDGVPASAGEFNEFIAAEIGTPEQIQILTRPEFFAENSKDMTWQRRREIVMSLTDDVTDMEVIETNSELEPLTDYLKKPGSESSYYTIDEMAKIARAEKSNTHKEIESIPERIDEVSRLMPKALSKEQLEMEKSAIESAQKEKARLEEEILNLKSTTDDQTKRLRIAEIKTRIAEIQSEYSTKNIKTKAELQEKQESTRRAMSNAQVELDVLIEEKADAERSLENINKLREDFNQRFIAIEKSRQEFKPTDICEYCQQKLPQDQIDNAIEHHNQHISKEKEGLLKQAKADASSDMVSAIEAEIERITALIEPAKKKLETKTAVYKEIENDQPKLLSYEEDSEWKELNSEIEGLLKENAEDKASEETATKIREIEFRIRDLDSSIDGRKSTLAKQKELAKFQERIAELEAQEKEMAKAFQVAEHKIYLAEQFIKTKADLLTDRINSKFKTLEFKLFEIQKNGGINPTCEVLVPSQDGNLVDFKSANNAGRINAGLEIIETLGQAWNQRLPVFVDNAESVNRLHQSETQLVAFYVTDLDEELNIKPMNMGEQMSFAV